MTTSKQNTTLCRVSFYTHDVPLNRVDAFDALDPKLRGPVMRWSYSDRLGQPSGQISITLKPHIPQQAGVGSILDATDKAFCSVLLDGDWWVIDVIKNGYWHKVGFGRIDNLDVQISAGRGESSVVETITGRTYGFGLEDTIVYFNPNDPTASLAQLVSLTTISENFAGTPDQVVGGIMNTILGSKNIVNGQHRVPMGIARPGTNTWVSMLDQSKLQSGLRGLTATAQLINVDDPNNDQTLWSIMDQWRNPMLNELFVDTNPLSSDRFEPYIVLREKPFENLIDGPASPWFKLMSWNVDWATVTGTNLRYGSNRVNHFLVMEALASQLSDDQGIFPPDVDTGSIQERGLRRMHETTNYGDLNATDPFLNRDWMSLVEGWNILNPVYWQGSINIGEMRPEIRKGQKIFTLNGPPGGYKAFPTDRGVPELAMSFYVEGVEHEWIDGPQPMATTSLTVSRGYVESKRLADIFTATQKLGASIAVTASARKGILDQTNISTSLEKAKQDAILGTQSVIDDRKIG